MYRLAALFWEEISQVARGGEATNCLEIPHQPITNQFNSSNCSRLAQLTAGGPGKQNSAPVRVPFKQIGTQLRLLHVQDMHMNIWFDLVFFKNTLINLNMACIPRSGFDSQSNQFPDIIRTCTGYCRSLLIWCPTFITTMYHDIASASELLSWSCSFYSSLVCYSGPVLESPQHFNVAHRNGGPGGLQHWTCAPEPETSIKS